MNQWEKYPREVVVMNKEQHEQFVDKCIDFNLRKSEAINKLIAKWLAGKISIK